MSLFFLIRSLEASHWLPRLPDTELVPGDALTL